jgi:hypothetical protein
MNLSVTAPLERALSRTREVLFEPFDLSKWLKLGFCAFLAHLADSSGGGVGGQTSWQQDGSRQSERAMDWVRDNWILVSTLGVAVLLVILTVAVLVLWLQGRGRFMFLDGVVCNRGAVVEPWHAYRTEGQSAFLFKLATSSIGFLASALAVAAGVGLAWADINAERFGAAAWAGALVGGGLLVVLVALFLLIEMMLADFVVPAMYARRIRVMEGWRVVRRELLAEHGEEVFLYVLVKIAIKLASFVLVVGLVCATLCVTACLLVIPYVGTVLLLPLFVFNRCYSIYFLEQLGGDWRLVASTPGPLEAS